MFKKYRIIPAHMAEYGYSDDKRTGLTAKYVVQKKFWFTWRDMQAFSDYEAADMFLSRISNTL